MHLVWFLGNLNELCKAKVGSQKLVHIRSNSAFFQWILGNQGRNTAIKCPAKEFYTVGFVNDQYQDFIRHTGFWIDTWVSKQTWQDQNNVWVYWHSYFLDTLWVWKMVNDKGSSYSSPDLRWFNYFIFKLGLLIYIFLI